MPFVTYLLKFLSMPRGHSKTYAMARNPDPVSIFGEKIN
jgi:hypothetical protein